MMKREPAEVAKTLRSIQLFEQLGPTASFESS